MAYNVQLPDGRTVEIDDSVDQETARRMIMQRFPDQFPDTKGFTPALKSAGYGALADIDAAMAPIARQFGNDSAADFYAQRSKANRKDSESGFNPTELGDIGKAYDTKGLSAAAGTGFDWLKEQAGSMIGRYGPALAASAVPVVGPALSLGALTGEETGANIERQHQVGAPEDLTSALGIGLIQGAIDRFGFGKMFSGVAAPLAEKAAADLVPQVLKGQITKDAAIDVLGGRLRYFAAETGANAALGAGMNTAIEGGRRLAAGQPVADDEALKTYGEGALGAAALSPFFGAAVGMRARHGAEKAIRDAAKANDDRVQMAERGQQAGFRDETEAAKALDEDAYTQQFYRNQEAARAAEQTQFDQRNRAYWEQQDARQAQFDQDLSQRIKAGVDSELASREAAQRNPDAIAAFSENQPDLTGVMRPDAEPVLDGRRATDQPQERPANPLEQPLLPGLEPEPALDRRATDVQPQPELSTAATFEGAVFPRAKVMDRIVGQDMGNLDGLRTVNEELRRYRDNVLAQGMTEKNAEQYTAMMNRIDEIRDNLKDRIAQLRNADQGQPGLKLPPGVALGDQRSSFLKAAPGEEPVLGINGVKNETVPAGFGERALPVGQEKTGGQDGRGLYPEGRGQYGIPDGRAGEQPVGLHGAREADLANQLPGADRESGPVAGGLAEPRVRGTPERDVALTNEERLAALPPERREAIERARVAMDAEDQRKTSMVNPTKEKASFSPDDWNRAIADYEASKKGENPQDYAPNDFMAGDRSDTTLTEDHPVGYSIIQQGEPLSAMSQMLYGQDPLAKEVAKSALKYPDLAPKSVKFDEALPEGKAGAYNHATDSIHLRPNAANERVLAHEYMHALTSKALEPGNFEKLTPQQKSAVQNIKSSFDTARALASKFGLTGHNGLKNVKEFVAEAFTNPQFQAALDKMPARGGERGITTLWDQFVRAVGKLLGWDKNHDSLLADTLRDTGQLIDATHEAGKNKPVAGEKMRPLGEGTFERKPETPPKVAEPQQLTSSGVDYAPAARTPYDQQDVAAPSHTPGMLEKTVAGSKKVAQAARGIKSLKDFSNWFKEASYKAEQRLFDWRLGVTKNLNRNATYIDEDGVRRATATELLAQSEYRGTLAQDSLQSGYLTKNSEGSYKVEKDDNNLRSLHQAVMSLPDELGRDKQKVLTNIMANLTYAEREAKTGETFERPSHVTDAMIAQALDDYKNIPEVKKAVDIVHEMNMRDIDFMESTNLIGKDLAAEFRKNKFYVPLDRVLDEENRLNDYKPSVGGTFSKTGDRFEGSERQVRDVMDSIVERRMRLADAGIRNDASYHTIKELEKEGQYGVRQMKDHTARAPEGWFKVKVLEEGRPTGYLLNDVNAYKSLRGLKLDAPEFMNTIEKVTGAFRNLIVVSPDFVLKNMFRDNSEAWMANYTHKNIASTFGESFSRFGRDIRKSSDDYDVVHYGLTGNREFTSAQREYESIIKQFKSTGSMQDKAARIDTLLSKLWDKANHISSHAEVVTRQTIFNAAKERTGSETEAIAAARNLLDFRRRGDWEGITLAKKLIPFFNSNLQGFYKYYRMATHGDTTGLAVDNAMRGLAIKGMYMAAATTAYAAFMSDHPGYQQASQNERDNFWLVPLPGTQAMLRVPIPYEVGAMFKTLPEVMFNKATGKTSDTEFKESLKQAFKRTFPFGTPQSALWYFTPQYAKPAYEVATNYNSFFDRPIERPDDLKIDPAMRTNERTTPLDRGIGAVTGLSPVQAAHLIKGYLGTVGAAVSTLTGLADTSKADRPINQTPLVGSLATDPTHSRDVDNYYAYRDKTSTVKATVDALKRRGDVQGLQAYLKEDTNGVPNAKLYQLNETLSSVDSQLATIRKAYNAVDYDSSLNSIQKRQRKDQLRAMQAKVAAQVTPQLRRLMGE